MLIRKAFKFQLMPNGPQQRDMRCYAGACRFVFNKALAFQQELYAVGDSKLSANGMCYGLKDWKSDPDLIWLRNSPSQTLQVVMKDLDRAYKNFFIGRADFPKFKKKGKSGVC